MVISADNWEVHMSESCNILRVYSLLGNRLQILLRSELVVKIRATIAFVRRHCDPFYRTRMKKMQSTAINENAPYENGDKDYWQPKVLDMETTMRRIIDKKLSVARFGDGEFEMIAGHWKDMTFQKYDAALGKRLKDVLKNPIAGCLNCIINVFGSLDGFTEEDKSFWRRTLLWMRPLVYEIVQGAEQEFGDPQISRPYMPFHDLAKAERIFTLWKQLFAGKDLLVVEGRYSRLGVGNDLFDNAKTVRRIWCPPTDAYASYDKIFAAVLSNAKKSDLILIALGQTATALAYDLAARGYWAIDIGHLDVEYMWMKMGAKEKIAIPGKYVNEAQGGHEMVDQDGEETANNVVATIAL